MEVHMSVPLSPMMAMNVVKSKPRRSASEVTVLADGNVVKLQKTRQRRIYSCVHCHSKKIKCSRVQPVCSNCDKIGIECRYFINERVSRGTLKPKLRASDTKSDLEQRLSRMRSSASEVSETTVLSSDFEDKKLRLPQKESVSESIFEDLPSDSLPAAEMAITGQMGGQILVVDPQKNNQSQGNHMQMFSPDSQVLQVPIANAGSNNITNNFFNTNYANKTAPADEQYLFNLSSFTFHTSPDALLNNNTARLPSPAVKVEDSIDSPTNSNGTFKSSMTNFVDGPSSVPNAVRNSHSYNPGLHNSLNALSSNPAQTVNYLYGTNTYYDNDNLLTDLVTHLPTSRERSFELIGRYINSVHLLFPVLVNLPEFLREHEKFWEHFDPNKPHLPASPSSSDDPTTFDLLQFYTLYFPVLYASTILEFEEYDNLLLNQDIAKYLKAFNRVCQYYNYPHGLKLIPLLLGNVIIQSTSPNPLTMEMSQIIRYAKLLHLHKDPVVSLRITDWKVIKFRRMLWWVIFGLDCLSSHNFCLPPVCKFDDFNVLMPDYEDPVFDNQGQMTSKKLNVTVLAMTIKFKYDRILSELVYQLHNGLATNITTEEIHDIKRMIVDLFHYIHKSIVKMNNFYKACPPTTVQEMNLLNFIKNHSWSYADRAMMLLHKKILLHDPAKGQHDVREASMELTSRLERGGVLSLSQYEDTFGRIPETNIVRNFDSVPILLLRFNQYELFTYENMHNNLIPSILHNLNDFLKYSDFIKFGKFNWYVKRTIPLDLIILLFVIICVKFKYQFMTQSELLVYVKLINKTLFILNRKYFKNEKYKRMLSLTNLTWEYILKKYNVVKLLNLSNEKKNGRIEFFDYQVSGFMNMSDLFNVIDVPQPALVANGVNLGCIQSDDLLTRDLRWEVEDSDYDSPEQRGMNQSIFSNQLIQQVDDKKSDGDMETQRLELLQLNEKVYYDLRNNFVDINDYCTFYLSLENVLHELMDYINCKSMY